MRSRPEKRNISSVTSRPRESYEKTLKKRLADASLRCGICHDVNATSMRHQYRYSHGSENCQRDAAQQDFAETGVTIAAHHDQIAAFVGASESRALPISSSVVSCATSTRMP